MEQVVERLKKVPDMMSELRSLNSEELRALVKYLVNTRTKTVSMLLVIAHQTI